MDHADRYFVDGPLVSPAGEQMFALVSPATAQPIGELRTGVTKNVDRALAAARAAFVGLSLAGRDDRLALLRRLLERYKAGAVQYRYNRRYDLRTTLPRLVRAATASLPQREAALRHAELHRQAGIAMGHLGLLCPRLLLPVARYVCRPSSVADQVGA
jgi:hypothetical protein